MENQFEEAKTLFEQYRLTEAQCLLENLVVNRPHFTEAWLYLGKICHRTQDYGKALNYFQKVLELHPDHEGAITSIKLIQDILKLTNNYYFENAYTDEDLYQ